MRLKTSSQRYTCIYKYTYMCIYIYVYQGTLGVLPEYHIYVPPLGTVSTPNLYWYDIYKYMYIYIYASKCMWQPPHAKSPAGDCVLLPVGSYHSYHTSVLRARNFMARLLTPETSTRTKGHGMSLPVVPQVQVVQRNSLRPA